MGIDSDDDDNSDSDDDSDDYSDEEYVFSGNNGSEEEYIEGDDDDEAEDGDTDPSNKFYLVDRAQLDYLFHRCQTCGGINAEKKKRRVGSMLVISTICENGHKSKWQSQETCGKQPMGNILIATAILLCGGLFSKFALFAEIAQILFIGRTTFFKIQQNILCPVINFVWHSHLQSFHDQIKGTALRLAGDARCDSPGYSATYGTYTLMNESGMIIDFQLVHVSEAKNSGAMEKHGLEVLLDRLQGNGMQVKELVTDRSPQIKTTMRTKYAGVNHQFDVWHFVKSVVKKLKKKAKAKASADLDAWIPSIANHLWWAASTCLGNATLLREKWLSFLHHCRNEHTWTDATLFMQCDHGELSGSKKKWLHAESAAYASLVSVFEDRQLLKDMEQLTQFMHTGALENYHSLMAMTCPKRIFFGYNAMRARTQLAAIRHNYNVGREQATTKSGKPRWNVVFPKAQKRWSAKKIYQRSSNAYVHDISDIVQETVAELQKKEVPQCVLQFPGKPAHIAENIAHEEKPLKSHTVASYVSRFAAKD